MKDLISTNHRAGNVAANIQHLVNKLDIGTLHPYIDSVLSQKRCRCREFRSIGSCPATVGDNGCICH